MDTCARAATKPWSEPPSTADVLRQIRDARFSGPIHCVRCGSPRVQRWGSFSDRQRYRCRSCRRTFSDLTGTPAAYAKKLRLWPSFAGCFERGLSVRASAAHVGIHPSTAFRWRHALARGLLQADREKLHGRTELSTYWFAESRKGQRRLQRTRRRRAVACRFWYRGPQACVFFACDREGHVVTQMLRERGAEEWDVALAGRFEGLPIIVGVEGFDGRPSLFACRIGAEFHNARPTGVPRALAHVSTVTGYIWRFRHWMARFRGVATKYLPNYLVWHRRVDEAHRHALTATALRWPIDVQLPTYCRPEPNCRGP